MSGVSIMFFFFFKQKTAYEIDCDWSSDVCSSDLCEVLAALGLPANVFEDQEGLASRRRRGDDLGSLCWQALPNLALIRSERTSFFSNLDTTACSDIRRLTSPSKVDRKSVV